MTYSAFLSRFPATQQYNGHFGVDLTDDTYVWFFTNDAGEVGEERYDRRSTTTTFSLLGPSDAATALAYYAAKKAREAADAPLLAQIRALLAQLSDDGRRQLLASL